MRFIFAFFFVGISSVFAQSSDHLTKIAFGSCGHQDHPLPIFNVIAQHRPDLFVFLGDNIYGDTRNMDVLRGKYEQLAAKPSYQKLKESIEIIATWDDHDYGENDAGAEYPLKKESKEVFLDFFDEPANSERRKREGVYTSSYYENDGKVIQVILLDCRTFRGKLAPYTNEFEGDRRYFYKPYYGIHQNDNEPFLGEQQWAWLERELKKPADLRIIGSGTQFGIEYNSYEAWANFPHEQVRMLNLISSTKANGVLFITGDVHYGEISELNVRGLYPIYDITSSGLSSTWHFATPNNARIEGPVMENHFGMITVDWSKSDPTVAMEIWDIRNNRRVEHTILLSEISFDAPAYNGRD
ncbi:MAG: alkaline phosphatase D family protein [Crocinitomicaceae bacterium]|nr:alkaline phosphatase D family protein [Crocinitomicaceae bacterium]